jgi:hypothetical protein
LTTMQNGPFIGWPPSLARDPAQRGPGIPVTA